MNFNVLGLNQACDERLVGLIRQNARAGMIAASNPLASKA